MIRKDFYISQAQNDFLKELDGLTVSEHIRRAIDEYIENRKKLLVSQSPSSTYAKGKGSN